MKQRYVRMALFAVMALLVMACFAPVAFAGQVTKIAYGSGDVGMWKITTGTYSGGVFTPATKKAVHVSIGWDLPTYTKVWPVESIGAMAQFSKTSDPYKEDWSGSDPSNWGGNDNPQWTDISSANGSDYYISVMSSSGENFGYTFDVSCDAAYQITDPSGSMSTVYAANYPFTSGNTPYATHHALAYNSTDSTQTTSAFTGEVLVPENGEWISCPQTWPGTPSLYYTQWQDYVSSRINGNADVLAYNYGVYDVSMWYPGRIGLATKLIPSGGSSPAHTGWYTMDPSPWGGAAAPNSWPVGSTMPMPGSLPLVNGTNNTAVYYTYSFPDSYYDGTAKNGTVASTLGYQLAPLTNATASKRSIQVDTTTGATISDRFAGNDITWYYQKNNVGVKVNVLIDGVAPTAGQGPSQVDQSNASTIYTSTSWTALGAGNHVITLIDSGIAGSAHLASPASKLMTHDKFVSNTDWGGTVNPTPDAEDSYDGMTSYRWGALANAGAHGGDFGVTTSTRCATAFTFNGTAFDIIYTTSNVGGKVDVYIDGVAQAQIDESSAATTYQVVTSYTGLTSGWHQVLVKASGTAGAFHIASPISKLYNIDAFRVGSTYYEN